MTSERTVGARRRSVAVLALFAGLCAGTTAAVGEDAPYSATPAYDMNMWRQLNTPGVQSMWDFGWGPSLDSLPHFQPPMPQQSPNLRRDSVPRSDRGRDRARVATPNERPGSRPPLPVVDPGRYHRAVFVGGEGPAMALNALCSYSTSKFNWRSINFYERERERYPKGTKFWVEVEVLYGNKSGTPNSVACPSNDQATASPMNTSLCVANYSFRNLGAVFKPPPAPDRQSECIQTRQMQLVGTGDIKDALQLSVAPSALRVELCRPFNVAARVSLVTAEGERQGTFVAPVRWAPSDGVKAATQLGQAGASEGRNVEVRAFEATKFGSHTINVFLEHESLSEPKMASIAVDVATPPPSVMAIRPFEDIALTVGDKQGFSLWGTRTASCGGDFGGRVDKIHHGIEWSASRGRFEGGVYHATEAGPVEITARWTDSYTKERFEAKRSLLVEERDDLVVSLALDKQRLDVCGRLEVIPTITTRSGKPIVTDPLAFDPALDTARALKDVQNVTLDWDFEGPGGVNHVWYAASGAEAVGTLHASFRAPGSYTVSARVRGRSESAAPGVASFEVVDMLPTSIELIPSKRKFEAGERITVEATLKFPEPPSGVPGFTPLAPELTASGGTIRDGTFWSSEPGKHKLTASYALPDQCGGGEVSSSTTVTVTDSKSGAHVDAWVTRGRLDSQVLGNAYSGFRPQ